MARNWGRNFCALIPPGAPVRFKPTSAFLPEMLRCFRNGSPKKCYVCKRLLSLNLPLGIIFMPLFCYPTSKIYIIFILPLLSIYFYFIAYHVGDIWLLNVWRIGPGCCFFFILPFVSACSDVLIFTKGMRQGHISIRTHTHTLITLPFYLTLRVCGYIYKSRQI